ncbi:MAG: MBOAT family protein [Lachnospiraceae bacterium]|nr:MBOAT family protein [Lachnospiraceae bacterium]
MIFNSTEFLIFFPIVTLIYGIIPKKIKYLWLLAASYYFYMCWNPKYASLIAISTIITYLAAIFVEKVKDKALRTWIMAGGFAVNLGILFFFKYFDFVLNNVNKVLNIVHINAVSNPFDILLPVGISFYTFQALGYMVDVYRGECKAQKNFFRYALYVSFFPQLVAGPIERSKNLLGQLEEMGKRNLMSFEGVSQGFAMMMWGLFMKMVIADRVALFVDGVFAYTYMIGTVEAVFGAIGFALQIYCDFAGYSAIAIGAAKVMGFDLMENFNTPYFATGIADFWRRWHISLSTWFREYLYIPLGGSRCSKIKKYRNLMITFLVSGLWHGAAWNFIIWGGIHGIYQIVEDLLKPVVAKINEKLHVKTDVFSYKLGQICITFALTTFAWIFFRAGSISQAILYIKNMFVKFNPWVLFDESLFTFGLDRREVGILMVAIIALVIVDIIRHKYNKNIGVFLSEQNLVFRWIVLIALIVCVLVYGEYGVDFDSNQFIYFDF